MVLEYGVGVRAGRELIILGYNYVGEIRGVREEKVKLRPYAVRHARSGFEGGEGQQEEE